MSDRGVSETLGFVLVFALVTGTIGIVYATGIAGLDDVQTAEKVNNVERAFDVLADNLKDLHQNGAPSRATEVNLAGGSLHTGEPVTIGIHAEKFDDPTKNATYNATFEPIVYKDESGTSIVYANGGVIRSDPGGSVMLSEPSWMIGPNRAVIEIVNTTGSGGGISGEGAVMIVAQQETRWLSRPFTVDQDSTARVTVTVTSPRVEVWTRFFEDQEFADIEQSGNSVSGHFNTSSVYVPRTGVAVSFTR